MMIQDSLQALLLVGIFWDVISRNLKEMDKEMIKKVVFFVMISTVVLFSCSAEGRVEVTDDAPGDPETAAVLAPSDLQNKIDADTSYSFGMILALQFGLNQVKIGYDYEEFLKGFRDAVEGKTARITQDEAVSKIDTAFSAAVDQLKVDNTEKEKEYLAQNGAKSGVTTTGSGLQYEIITEGTGPKPTVENTVKVHYEGTLLDGTVFDSSYSRNEPVEFSLSQVIRGWSEGIQLMTVGSTYRFVIPSALAYGEQGNNTIPPNSTLIFKVELLSVVE
ncbi:MAG: FKBP-type peptidyl-prolyl cis-trans isomerase [Treponema sp.]|jgi:FKBP-type peptidyl-prolyl cis-trans isomerase|nr:FKBP-type peptidyl-prolyl cis-trans isomerase [Treponema sp.]